jgi:putative membrane protein
MSIGARQEDVAKLMSKAIHPREPGNRIEQRSGSASDRLAPRPHRFHQARAKPASHFAKPVPVMTILCRHMLAASLALTVFVCAGLHAQTEGASDRATPSPSSQANSPDVKFVAAASASGLAEVGLGKLGVSQGESQAVKEFGQQMVTDHTKANEELKSIAQGKSLPLSTQPMPSDASAATMIASKRGAEFDAAFKNKMVADHEKAVKLFEKESTSGNDPDLKAFAGKTLPTLKHHLEMAQQLHTSAK